MRSASSTFPGLQASGGRRVRLSTVVCLLFTVLGAWTNPPLLTHAEVWVAPPDSSWRLFRTSDAAHDSFATAITVGYKENIWVKRGPFASASRLDGYSILNIPSPDDLLDDSGYSNHKIYESRSGQIWSLYSGGLAEFKQDKWSLYPVDIIRFQILTNMSRKINLIPTDRDHTLFLLPDALHDFEGVSRRTNQIRTSQDLGIGALNEMVESNDGHLWILGEAGVVKVEGPVRQIRNREGVKQERFHPPWPIRNGRRLMLDDRDGILFIADRVPDDGPLEKVGVHFDGSSWSMVFGNQDKFNYIWKRSESGYWALSPKAIHILKNDKAQSVKEGQFFDVATSENGVFFLATSKGVLRYAQPTWKHPFESDSLMQSCFGILTQSDNVVRISSAQGLISMEKNRVRLFPWPEEVDSNPDNRHQLFELPNGRILIGMDNDVWEWSETRGIRRFEFPDGTRPRSLLGQLSDGRILIQLHSEDSTTETPGAVRSYDGETWRDYLSQESLAKLGENIYFVHQLRSGRTWIGGTRAIALQTPDSLNPMDYRSGFPADHAFCMTETGDGKVWVGAGSLVLQFDGREWEVVARGLGKINDILSGPDNNVWVATSRGIYRYRENSWVLNQTQESLPSNRIYDLGFDGSGGLLAATSAGLVLYNPGADKDPPICRITDPINLDRIETGKQIRINLTATDRWEMSATDRILYSHRINAGQWSSFSTNNWVELPDLQAGVHHIEFRSMDRNWNIQNTPTEIKFSAFVPFYKDPQVMGLSICGFLLTLFFAWLAVNQHLKLKKSYAEVESQVAQRTRELEKANSQLLQMQKMKALGTLAAGVAHDFNSILSVIKGSAQIIERNPLNPEKVQARIDRIKTVVDQGTILVKAMLGISGSGSGLLAVEDCDINALAERSTRLLEDKLGPDIVVKITADPRLPSTKGSPELIQQMLFNLLINAADAMNNEGEIQIKTYQCGSIPFETFLKPAKSICYLIIEIIDFGCGISTENLNRIFEPFFTTKAFSSRKGTGLGLSMVYEFAGDMGYGLGVDSILGEGSTFRIVIPVITSEQT